MKSIASAIVLCFVFLALNVVGAEARGRHNHRAVSSYSVHRQVVQHPLKFRQKQHVVAARAVAGAGQCIFLCMGHADYGYDVPRRIRNDRMTTRHLTPRESATRMLGIVPRSIRYHETGSTGVGRRPGAWCGWWMQIETGITSATTKLNLNRAIEWARVGRPTTPSVGAIVVWPHHVGKIVGIGSHGRYIVKSGNDGHAVRERERSVAGAVAFRTL